MGVLSTGTALYFIRYSNKAGPSSAAIRLSCSASNTIIQSFSGEDIPVNKTIAQEVCPN